MGVTTPLYIRTDKDLHAKSSPQYGKLAAVYVEPLHEETGNYV